MQKLFLVFLLMLAAFASPAHAGSFKFDITVKGGREIILLTLPEPGRQRIFTLENPNRLVVDLPTITSRPKIAIPKDYKGQLVQSVRVGQFDATTTRLVFDLSAKPELVKNSTAQDVLSIELIADAKNAKNVKGGNELVATDVKKKSISGDERPVIIIDAGHGGQDPGTSGPSGTQEKDVVLEYGRALRNELLASKRYRVVMTRDGDSFILLRERINIARKAEGSLFISLHADSAPGNGARGLSVYTLSENASDKEAEALATRENRADVLSGLDLSGQSEDVAGILISLAQRETNVRSDQLATSLVNAMSNSGIRLLAAPHRSAGFAVLKAPDMPSVLVEIGFLSNAQEEKQLDSKKYRAQLVQGLAKGIDAYFKNKQH